MKRYLLIWLGRLKTSKYLLNDSQPNDAVLVEGFQVSGGSNKSSVHVRWGTHDW